MFEHLCRSPHSPQPNSREYRFAERLYTSLCVYENAGFLVEISTPLLERSQINCVANLLTRVMSGPEMVPADLEQLVGVIRQQAMEIMSLRQELVNFRTEITALRTETAGLRAECEILRSDLTALQADHDDLTAATVPPAEPIRQSPPVTLRTAYYEGLSTRLRDELAVRELPDTLEGMIQLALRVDQRMNHTTKTVFRSLAGSTGYHRTPEPSTSHAVAASPPPPPVASEAHSTGAGEPMQIGRTSLSAAERARRYREGLCAYCASPGPPSSYLPSSSGKRTDQVRRGRSSSGPNTAKTYPESVSSRLLLQVSILMGHQRIETTAFVDSGAAGNFIDQAYAAQMGIVIEALSQPLKVTAIDGRPLTLSPITHRTQELTLIIENHSEAIQFYVTKIPSPAIILGHPWLVTHDPLISWTSRRIIHWGATCQELCLRARVGTCSGEPGALDVDREAIPVQYRDLVEVFSRRSAARLPPHRPYDLAIDLVPGAVPPRGHLYSLSAKEQLTMEEYVAEGLRAGTIRPSSSPAAAGFFFVKKKDGGLRLCVDYRGLNQITVKNRHPLPLTNTALDALSGAHFFTKLDLRSAYNLVRIREGDEWKTAFITPTGHYETLVMPFGLCNSPAAFQHFINDVLRDMLGRWCYAYLDDILIYSKTLEEHTQHVRAVLQRLLAHQLYCKLEKCAFHQHSTTFLGFIISAQGVAMDPQKLEAVRSWPLPTSLKQLQRFLGFANFYRRFIRGFSSTAAPLTALTKPSRGEFHLTPEAIQAFRTLCHQFTTAPILTHPDPTKAFVVEEPSLSQRGPDEKLHPCSFFSRKFNSTQQRYGVGDRELLAIKWALEEWRHWLQGGSEPFTVWTDHQNLTVIKQTKQLNPRQARWALFFEHFDFHLSYRPGSKNTKADALSHHLGSHPVGVRRESHSQEPPPPETPAGRLFVPNHLRQEVLQWGHDSTLAGHQGVQRTIRFISRAFWWRTLRRDVQEYVLACNICARSKNPNAPSTGELQPLPIPKRPWTHISIDFVSGLPESQGKNTILTIVDRFSKAVHLVALSGLPSAKTTAELILEHVVRLHGFPQDIVSDRGPQFTAKFWQAFCCLVGTTSSLSSGFHPQTNGQTERANQQLERFLRCFASEHQRSWASYLVWAELSNNLHTSTATGLSPFEVCYGFQPPIFEHQEPEVEVPSAQQLVRRCRRLWNHARAAIQKANRRYVVQHRRRHPPGRLFHVGDRVYLSTKNINLKTDSRKLTPRYIGPFKITHRLNPVTFRLQLPASLRVHPIFHQSQLKPVFFSPLSPQAPAPPPPRIVDGGPAYTVRRILDSRPRGRGIQYLVDWEGYGPEERSWVPGRFILDPALIQDYRRRVSSTPGPSAAGPGGGGTVTRTESREVTRSRKSPHSPQPNSREYRFAERLYTSLCVYENAGFLVEISTPLLERSQINCVANLLTRVYPRLSSPSRYTGTYPRSTTSCLASLLFSTGNTHDLCGLQVMSQVAESAGGDWE
ncbi:Transposon Tf2-6 polyprotein [Labeo rohita]|uniref:Gypsy retrotransposon integrase-like protein 1 n=1 Tax=Labeo rohita TaxID=84645 RepID=A0ABQ8MMN3_LABRO|nr:Transposon Tf2-6 polyprotein [Labeo rohita]